MKARKGFLSRLVKSEDGLVTVEWVALASAMVVGAIAIGWLVMSNLKTPANQIGAGISTAATATTSQGHP